MSRYENRMQLALALLVGLLLVANLFTLALVALTPATRVERAPVLFAVFVITLVVSVPSILLLPRWLLRPYRQLVDEAERAPVSTGARGDERDETEFVLETFQEVVAQLRSKQRELERLSAQASERAESAERFSERIVASLPSGLLAFNSEGRATVVNQPARNILELDGEVEGHDLRAVLGASPELARLVERCLRTGEVYRREEVSAEFEAASVPPCSVTTRWASARPTPWPLLFVVKKGMKTRCKSSGAMPRPVSSISTTAHTAPSSPASREPRTVTRRSALSSGMASAALRRRLRSACRSILSSACTPANSPVKVSATRRAS